MMSERFGSKFIEERRFLLRGLQLPITGDVIACVPTIHQQWIISAADGGCTPSVLAKVAVGSHPRMDLASDAVIPTDLEPAAGLTNRQIGGSMTRWTGLGNPSRRRPLNLVSTVTR